MTKFPSLFLAKDGRNRINPAPCGVFYAQRSLQAQTDPHRDTATRVKAPNRALEPATPHPGIVMAGRPFDATTGSPSA